MLWLEPNAREISVIEPTVSGVLREQKRVMNLVISPEGHSVFVILLKLFEDWLAFYRCIVVCIETDEEELCF